LFKIWYTRILKNDVSKTFYNFYNHLKLTAMRTLKIFFVLCIILSSTAINALAQSDKKHYDPYWWSPAWNWECVGEPISGDIYVSDAWGINLFWHEKGHGELTGQSGTIYTLDWVVNQIAFGPETPSLSMVNVFPMFLRREGKLVAVIYQGFRFIVNGEGLTVVDRTIIGNINCVGN
jgi:hypothetical protein